MLIRRYIKAYDESALMRMIENEDGWDYATDLLAEKYKKSLIHSITYVAYEGDELCAYSRSMDDVGLYVYVLDLLVKPGHRGKNIGRQLMEFIYKDYPDRVVYVLSGADDYYTKIAYKKEGSIFEVKKPE